jgi:hypothetical protein
LPSRKQQNGHAVDLHRSNSARGHGFQPVRACNETVKEHSSSLFAAERGRAGEAADLGGELVDDVAAE